MKIHLLIANEPRRSITVPAAHADSATVDGACPKCSALPFRVQGGNQRPAADDRAWEADGHCVACRAYVGVIRAEVDTLFGVREDAAVLTGRCRVY